MESTTIAISGGSCFGIGDDITFTIYETRWWKKLLNCMFDRSNESKSIPYKITDTTETSISIYNDISEAE